MTFKCNDELNVILNNVPIEKVNVFKFLGFLIDDKLSHKNHLNHLVSKLRKLKFVSYKIAPYMTLLTAKMFYFSMVFSALQYGILVWGGVIASNSAATLNNLHLAIVKNLFRRHFHEDDTLPSIYNEITSNIKYL